VSVGDNRRPIAARGWRISQAAADFLVRRHVDPNAISLAGMVAGLLAGAALWSTARYPETATAAWLIAALLIELRLVANMLDGMVAIGGGTASKLGELYNDLPDRVSDAAVLIGLGYAAGGEPTLGYLAALGAIATAYVRAVGQVAGVGATFGGPMAKQHRMQVVTLCALYGAVAGPFVGTELGLPSLALGIIIAGTFLTVILRLRRIAQALRRR
jgi:phosphatidylglycerophosphate synthase